MDAETKALIDQTARTAAGEAVRHCMTALGVDSANPLEAQKDFAALRELRLLFEDDEVRQDLRAMRNFRLAMAKVKMKALLTAVSVAVPAILTLVWLGLKNKL